MLGGNRRRVAGLGLATLGAALALAAPAFASGDRVVGVRDACDPATFNAALGAGTCVRADDSGRFVTFDDFIARVTKRRSHEAWRFDREKVTLKAGQSLVVEPDRGGEFHTFTEVPEFGPGCVPQLNMLVFPDQDPESTVVPNCGAAFANDGVPPVPGFQLRPTGLTPGTHLFECAIHPWMRTTVTVR
jgi:hypothetical protein